MVPKKALRKTGDEAQRPACRDAGRAIKDLNNTCFHYVTESCHFFLEFFVLRRGAAEIV
jgi:hypothetical protein